MKNTEAKIVKIAEPKGQTTLSRGQKLFNKLIKKIEKERKNLAAWQAAIPVYQQKCSTELDPLVRSYDQQRTELVRLFDAVYADKIFTKNEKAKLSDIICALTMQMVAEGHNPDDEQLLKQLYNKYSGSDYDAELEEETALMKSMMEGALGVELGDDADFGSPEKLIAQMHAQMQKKLEQEAQEQEAAEERKSKRKKSAKTLAKEARQQEEEKNVSQSIREVFRKLASALHPDR
ncbi:MAG: molecular chaperone DnaJ, partial [Oxalobacteraceae bacterium]